MSIEPKKVRVIALGGTIAMNAVNGALTPTLNAAELLPAFDGNCSGLLVDWEDFAQIASANIAFSDLVSLAKEIERLQREGYHGVVVTQGTDTLEETAFALELLVSAPIDIALTGAMRGSNAPGADGPANLSAALRFLETSTGEGEVVVLMNDSVHSARHVSKAHTTSLSAFLSREHGLRGRIHEGRFIAFNPAPDRLPKIEVNMKRPIPVIQLVTIGLDQSPWIFRAAGHETVNGWVIAAMGAGHVPEKLVPDLSRLSSAVPVVLCSRIGSGPICTATYGFPGAEIDLLQRGLLPSGNLSPLKARVLLTLLLMADDPNCRSNFATLAMAV